LFRYTSKLKLNIFLKLYYRYFHNARNGFICSIPPNAPIRELYRPTSKDHAPFLITLLPFASKHNQPLSTYCNRRNQIRIRLCRLLLN